MSLSTCLLALSLFVASVPSPHTPITPGPMAPATDPQIEARRLARHADRLVFSGSAVLIAGCAAWGTMIGGMWFGALERRSHDDLVTAINAEDRPPRSGERDNLALLDRQGARSNSDAIVSAIVGAAVSVVGMALLGRGLALRKRQGRRGPLGLAMSWRPGH